MVSKEEYLKELIKDVLMALDSKEKIVEKTKTPVKDQVTEKIVREREKSRQKDQI